jgi:C4-type Zn-finger protein
MKTCPVCDAGKLHPIVRTRKIEYQGRRGWIRSYYSLCYECETVVTDAEESQKNKDNVLEFRNKKL